jgi:hypothetical protein
MTPKIHYQQSQNLPYNILVLIPKFLIIILNYPNFNNNLIILESTLIHSIQILLLNHFFLFPNFPCIFPYFILFISIKVS